MPRFDNFDKRYSANRDWFGWLLLVVILSLGGYIGWNLVYDVSTKMWGWLN